MKIRLIILAIASATMPISAQINKANTSGYLTRAIAMDADAIYRGTTDQALQALRLHPSASESERADWLRANAALSAGETDAAELFEAYLHKYPESPLRSSAKLGLATAIFYEHHYGKAIAILDDIDIDALNLDEADDLIYRRSYSLMMLGDNAEAGKGFNRLASTKRYGNAARFYQGYIAYTSQDYDRALSLMQSVDRSTAPGNMAGYYMAQIYYVKSNWNKAIAEARPLIDNQTVDSSYRAEATRIVGESLWNLGDESSALSYLNNYLTQTSSPQPSALYILGVADYRSANYRSAIARLSSVTEQPGVLGQSASLTIGQAYLQEENYDAALMSLEKAIRMDCDSQVSETAYYNYAVAKMAGGRVPFSNSVATLEDFVTKYPSSQYADKVQQYIIDGYTADNNYAAALRSINAVKTPSTKVLTAKQRVLFMLSTSECAAGNHTDALQHLNEAITLDKYNADIATQCRLWRADCLYSQGEYSAADADYTEYLNKTTATDPNRTTANYGDGYALLALKKYDAARSRFSTVAADNSIDAALRADTYNRIADTYYYQSRITDAQTYYRKAYQTSPDNGDYALFQEAMMLGHNHDNRGKLSALNNMVKQFPTSSLAAEALLEKAQTYVALGENSNAISAYNDVIAQYPNTAHARNAMLQLAVTYRNNSDMTRATGTYRSIISTYPTSEEASVAVDDLKAIYTEQGRISDLDSFLKSVPSAPQLSDAERSSLSARSLWNQALAATDSNKALSLLTELTDKYPHAEVAEDALAMRADTEYSLGRTEAAARSYKSLESKASSATTLAAALLGEVRTGRDLSDNATVIAAADRLLSSSAAGSGYISEVRYARACAYAATNRTADARSEWSALAATPSDIYGSKSAVALAESYYKGGQTDKGLKVINAFIDANPPHAYWLARGFILLSDMLRSQGNTYEANEYLRSLRSNYPGSEADIFDMIDSRLK